MTADVITLHRNASVDAFTGAFTMGGPVPDAGMAIEVFRLHR